MQLNELLQDESYLYMKVDGASLPVAVSEDLVDVDAGHDDLGDEELNVQFKGQKLLLQLSLEHGYQVLPLDLVDRQFHSIKSHPIVVGPCSGNHLRNNDKKL